MTGPGRHSRRGRWWPVPGGHERRRPRWPGILLLLISTAAGAANPLSYSVEFAATGDHGLDEAIKGASQLESLRGGGPIAVFVLIGRAQQDLGRLQSVLEGFGYYQGKVAIRVDGLALSDPALPDEINFRPKDSPSAVSVDLEPGPLYHLRRITVDGELPERDRAQMGIAEGDPAVATAVLKAQENLLSALQEDGFARATVDAPVADEDPAARVLDVRFKVNTGDRLQIGNIAFTGLDRVREGFVRQRLQIHPGEQYSPRRIEAARQDLLSLGVFSAITVRAGEQLDAQGRLPITFDAQERLRHAVGFTGAYSTDLGGSVKATWSHRNLLGNAEQLNLSAAVTGLGGADTLSAGYNVSVQYVEPDFHRRDQSFSLTLGAIKQNLDAYDQTALSAGLSLNRKLSTQWSASAGISMENEQILQESVARDYTLLGVAMGASFNSTGLVNPLDDARQGLRASLTVTPTESVGASHATFIIAQATGSAYFDLAKLGLAPPGRTVIATRALVGNAHGAAQFSLPPDQRFYGGGSTTVRGYRYQSIGPQFADGNPIGGTSIDSGTIELRQRITDGIGCVGFVDAGQVSAGVFSFHSDVHVGTGLGLRYYTPIGPIRLDLAVPFRRQAGTDSFEIYIGIGQAF